jgi:HNH endonuclease
MSELIIPSRRCSRCGVTKPLNGRCFARSRKGFVQNCLACSLPRPPARPLRERFWEKVNKSGPTPEHCPELGPCWLWTGCKNRKGYGRISTRTDHSEIAHRVAWLLAHGRWPDPCALHRCDNPACVRLEHLFEGTLTDNNVDMGLKGRASGGSMAGERNCNAKLTAADVREIRSRLRAGTPQNVIARAFGVTSTAICSIVAGRTWCHVR